MEERRQRSRKGERGSDGVKVLLAAEFGEDSDPLFLSKCDDPMSRAMVLDDLRLRRDQIVDFLSSRSEHHGFAESDTKVNQRLVRRLRRIESILDAEGPSQLVASQFLALEAVGVQHVNGETAGRLDAKMETAAAETERVALRELERYTELVTELDGLSPCSVEADATLRAVEAIEKLVSLEGGLTEARRIQRIRNRFRLANNETQ